MSLRRRSLRKILIALGCVVATVENPSAMIGGLLLLVGSGLHFWSKGILEQNRQLTTAGPYRWTRNPFYLANGLIDLGLCFVIGEIWLAAVFWPLWILSYRETIAREQRKLLTLFPDEFPVYRDAVPALLPSGRRLDAAKARGQFRLHNDSLLKGREYARLLGIWLAPAVLFGAQRLRELGLAVFEAQNALLLAFLCVLPALWIVKLGLAEALRRPATALLPFASRRELRYVTMLILVGVVFVAGQPWLTNLPLAWLFLFALDHLGESRLAPEARPKRFSWAYQRAILAGGILFNLAVGLLIHRATLLG